MTGVADSPIRAVIFDWDLTLWNSWDIHRDTMLATADHLGHPRPKAGELAREYSRPFLEHLEWFFPGDQREVEETYLEFYRRSVWQGDRVYTGVAGVLQALKDGGYGTAIFSDKRDMFGEPELDYAGLRPLLDCVSFLYPGRPYKPDPAGLFAVMEALGAAPGECLFVGDSYRDIECAQRAGTRSGAALWATVERERLLACSPDYCLESIGEALAVLEPDLPERMP